jgi:hypothetical protein
MQPSDFAVCFTHMLARYPIPMIDVQSNGYRSNKPLSSHFVATNLTLPAQGDRGQPPDSPVFQADRHSRSPLIRHIHGCSNPLRSYYSFSRNIYG